MYINTETLEYPVTEQEIKQLYSNISFPNPFIPPKEYAVVFPAPKPEYDTITHAVIEDTPVLTAKGSYEQQWKVVELPVEIVEANQAAKAESDAKSIASKIELLWQAADKYTTGYISGVAIGILTIGVLQQKPKALAVSAWSNAIWSEYYNRKSQVTANSQDDLDFSTFGAIPYSIPELQAEIGL